MVGIVRCGGYAKSALPHRQQTPCQDDPRIIIALHHHISGRLSRSLFDEHPVAIQANGAKIMALRLPLSVFAPFLAERVLAVAALLCIFSSPLRATEPETNVLFLHGADPYVPAQLLIEKTMRDELAKNPKHQFRFFAEAMDAQRFVFGEYEQDFLSLLTKKYKGISADIIVTTTKQGLDFAVKHRSALWPDAKILFYSVSARVLEGTSLEDRTAGLILTRKIAETVDMARRLQPDAHRLVVIAGVSELDKDVTEEARKVLSARSDGLELEFLLGLPQGELVDRVTQEPTSSIVLFLLQVRDREGRQYTSQNVVRKISAASKAPVYGYVDSFLGEGIVGGVLLSYEELGRMIAQRLLQFAAGAPVPTLAVVPSHCMADARALGKWSLNQSNLPESCEVRFVPWSVWDAYRWQIVGLCAVVLVQALLISLLLVERRRRSTAEEEAGNRRREVIRLNRVTTANVLSSSIAHELNQPLGAILSNTEAAQMLLEANPPNLDQIREILSDIVRDDQRAGEIILGLRNLLNNRAIADLQPCDMNDTVRDVARIILPEATRRGVVLRTILAPEALPVRSDPIHLQQVMLNLVMNGMDAMDGVPSPQNLTIRTHKREHPGAAVVAISDSGKGIPEKDLANIFYPFVTTKPQGTGLGLPIARTIVESYGGQIWAENRQRGALFGFIIPLAKNI